MLYSCTGAGQPATVQKINSCSPYGYCYLDSNKNPGCKCKDGFNGDGYVCTEGLSIIYYNFILIH